MTVLVHQKHSYCPEFYHNYNKHYVPFQGKYSSRIYHQQIFVR